MKTIGKLRFLVSLTIVLAMGMAEASVHLSFWWVENYPDAMVLPIKDGETPEQAVLLYKSSLKKFSDMDIFIKRVDKLKFMTPFQGLGETEALVIANDELDMSRNPESLQKVVKLVNRNFNGQSRVMVLPIAATLRLSRSERQEFHRQIAKHFPLLVPKGGDDVHPKYYNEPVTYSLNLNPTRDALEIELIQDFYKMGPGLIFGICRGAQITSVAFGNKMYQDIQLTGLTNRSHRDGVMHDIFIYPVANNFLSQALNGQEILRVNSYHHQGIQLQNKNDFFKVVATSPDGVVEAIQSVDNRIYLTQFHPEIYPTSKTIGPKITHYITERSRKLITRSCHQLFN